MASRVLDLVLALAGLIVVGILVAWGIDAARAATAGPRWRRRLVTAALALLAALGVPAAGAEAAPPKAAKPDPADSSADWQAIHEAWAAALPLAKSGKSTTAQRKAADAKMKAAAEAAKRLVAKGLLASQEADLLNVELANLRSDIYREPPTDCKVTCYDMAYISEAQQSLQRLNKRLPLLEKLLARGKVNAVAGAKIIAGIEADLAILSDANRLRELGQEQQSAARAASEKARRAVQRLRELLPPRPTCYIVPVPAPRTPKTQSYFDLRLRRLDALERERRLRPLVAALIRKAIKRERAGS